MKLTDVGLLTPTDRWSGRLFTDGWTPAPRRSSVREPATGHVIGEVGTARPDDVPEAS
jgi:hypothetical protein